MCYFSRPRSENPYNFDIGSEVMYLENHAVIKWIGALPGNKNVQAGIEMVVYNNFIAMIVRVRVCVCMC